jgi:hypothetical protein
MRMKLRKDASKPLCCSHCARSIATGSMLESSIHQFKVNLLGTPPPEAVAAVHRLRYGSGGCTAS